MLMLILLVLRMLQQRASRSSRSILQTQQRLYPSPCLKTKRRYRLSCRQPPLLLVLLLSTLGQRQPLAVIQGLRTMTTGVNNHNAKRATSTPTPIGHIDCRRSRQCRRRRRRLRCNRDGCSPLHSYPRSSTTTVEQLADDASASTLALTHATRYALKSYGIEQPTA